MPSTIASGRSFEQPPCIIQDQAGNLYIANGIDPPVRYDGLSASVESWGMEAPTAASTTTLDTGGASTAGDYVLYYRYVDDEGIPSNLSPVQTLTATDNQKFNWVVTAPTDSRATGIQLFRSDANQSTTVYLVATLDANTTTYTDQLSDTQLKANFQLRIDNQDGTTNANRFTPPPAKAYFASFYDRFFAAGDVVYSRGNVELTNNDATVTGIGTAWTSAMAGRKIYFAGDPTEYEIQSVTSPTELELTTTYAGSTAKFVPYAIRAPRSERQKFYYTRPLEPESWPVLENVRIQEDGDDITGLMPLKNFLFVLEKRHLYVVTMSSQPSRPSNDQFPGVIVRYGAARGCINNRCWVRVEDEAYLLDYEGIYRFNTSGIEPISPPIQDFFREGKLNWKASRYWFASINRGEEVIRWHVSLGGSYLPRHALCYAWRRSEWWTESYPWALGAASEAVLNGHLRPLFGGEHQKHYSPEGTLDGLAGTAQIRGSVTAATLVSLTDDSAAFDASLVGAPLCIVQGKGVGQVRRIVDATATTLTVKHPWRVLPDATSVYLVGGVPWRFRSKVLRYVEVPQQNARSIELTAAPTDADSTVSLRLYIDRKREPSPWATDGSENGFVWNRGEAEAVCNLKRHRSEGRREWDHSGFAVLPLEGRLQERSMTNRFLELEILGWQGAERQAISSVSVEGVL